MTDKERVEKIKNGKFAVHCGTEEEAKEFIEWCYRNDIRWTSNDNDNDTIRTYFYVNKENTCYKFNIASGGLLYSSKKFYKNNGSIVITFKEFMNNPITNLEYILNNFDRETILNTDSICMYIRTCLGMQNCVDDDTKRIKIHCCECKFNDQYEVLKCLNEIYKEPITKLTKVQYEILKCLPTCSKISLKNNKINIHKDNLEYFLSKIGVQIIESDCDEKQIKIKDILEKCEVVE